MYNNDDDEVQLNSGEAIRVAAIESNGATWRLEVEQVQGHPGDSQPSIVVEGCVPGLDPFSLSFVNSFAQR